MRGLAMRRHHAPAGHGPPRWMWARPPGSEAHAKFGQSNGARHRTARDPAAGLEPVTALLCTVQDFPGELAAHYPGACAMLGLLPRTGGYTLRLARTLMARAGRSWPPM